jgi:two-component system, LytTR family, response regulator
MYKTLVVEDEVSLRKSLINQLNVYKNSIEIVGEANTKSSAIEQLNRLKPNLLFLDINLGKDSAFEVLEECEWKEFIIVFVTAFDNFAINAFKFNTINYLLKPISDEDISETIQKLQKSKLYEPQLLNSISKVSKLENKNKITISTSEGVSLFEINELVHLQSDGNYTIIYTEKEKLMVAKTLKQFEDYLTIYGFERVHNSHLINKSKIKKYIIKDGGFLIMSNNNEVPVSQRKKTYVLNMIDNL